MFPFVFLGNALAPEMADIQPNLVEWCHLTRFEPYFQGSHEKSVVCPGKLGAPKDSTFLDKSPVTAYENMVDIFPCTTAVGIPSPALHVWAGTMIQVSSVADFRKVKSIRELSSLDPEP